MSRTGADAVGRLERLEERPADQEVGAEDVVGGRLLGLAAGLEQPDLEHLARVVPLVDRGVDVEPLVALEPDEPGPERGRQDLGQLGLADAGLALEEERAAELEGQEDRGRHRSVGDVVAAPEVVLDRLDRAGAGGAGVAVSHRRNLHGRGPDRARDDVRRPIARVRSPGYPSGASSSRA